MQSVHKELMQLKHEHTASYACANVDLDTDLAASRLSGINTSGTYGKDPRLPSENQ
jgi:hypothetical protein